MHNGIGQLFAEALARKDTTALLGVLDSDVDFRGLTPGRFWEASSARALVDDVLLGAWFEADDRIDSLESVELGSVADRSRVSYRLRVSNPEGVYLVEQQAYFGVENGRINWLRVLCSGYRAIDAARP